METPLMSIEKGLQSSKRWITTLYTLLYIRVMITLSYILLGELITAEPTLQPYLLQHSSRPCSYRQPEHSEADRHRLIFIVLLKLLLYLTLITPHHRYCMKCFQHSIYPSDSHQH